MKDEKTLTFIEKAKKVHGDKYDYSKVEYINSKTKVCIICPKHGEFWQEASSHLRGHGCLLCYNENRSKLQCCSKEKFIKKAKLIHGNKYDYSKIEYKNNRTKICIICSIHGDFWITPDSLIQGKGCQKCGIISARNKNKMNQDDFIKRANEIHGNKYDYSKVGYINTDTKVKIVCPEHGEFEQTPHHHLNGHGCSLCGRNNLSENKIYEKIKGNFSDAIRQYSNTFLIENGHPQFIDIYIPSKKIGIEYQGRQHFTPVNAFGGKLEFEKQKIRDLKKYNKSKENGIKILYFSYEKEIPENYIDKIYTQEEELLKTIENYDN